MQITFLGQAGFLFETQKQQYLIDPYLSNYVVTCGAGDASLFSREFPAPIPADLLRNVTAIWVTHDHADHCDPETIKPILANNRDCLVIGPQPALDHLISEGVDQKNLRLAQVFSTKTIGSIQYTPIPSAHYGLDQDPISGEFPNLGFVLNCEGKTIYHSGDTILYDGLSDILCKLSPVFDICCLPVNGRDARREAMGMIGNLQPHEALELAAQLKTNWLIPMHNDLFKVNQLNPESIAEDAKRDFPHQKLKWMKAGEVITY